jgi:hypothetical protein
MIERLRVGAIEYRVRIVARLLYEDEVVNGHISHDDCLIEVDAGLDPQTRAVTVWHEVLHALMVQRGMPEHDEGLIDSLAYGIVGVLRDNPEMQDVMFHV